MGLENGSKPDVGLQKQKTLKDKINIATLLAKMVAAKLMKDKKALDKLKMNGIKIPLYFNHGEQD
jgi:hypothetical protein